MMREKRRRIAAGIMALLMVVSMTGCGKEQEKKEDQAKNYVFAEEPLEVGQIEGDMSSIRVVGDMAYFSTYEWKPAEGEEEPESSIQPRTQIANTIDDDFAVDSETAEQGETVYRYYQYSVAERGGLQQLAQMTLPDSDWINTWNMDADGNLILLISHYDEKTQKEQTNLKQMNDQGEEIASKDVTELVSSTEGSVSGMLIDGDGNYVLIAGTRLTVVDKELQKKGEVTAENYIECAALTQDGRVICGWSAQEGAQIEALDMDSMAFTDTYVLEASYFYGNDCLMTGNGPYDFYYRDASAIYGYIVKEKKSEKVMDFVASSVSADQTGYIFALAEGQFLASAYGAGKGEGESTGPKVSLYTKVDPSQVKDKQTLVLGGTYLNDVIKEAAIAFNKASDQYTVQLREYSNYEDPEKQFAADIVSGNIPDILCITDLPLGQYVSKGVLEDLTPYFEKDGLNKELLPSVAQAMQTNEKYYYVTPYVMINSVCGDRDIVGDDSDWTVEKFLKVAKEQGENAKPFYYAYRSSLLNNMVYSCMDDYVDWTTGECYFDTKEFRDLITFCKENGYDEDYEIDFDVSAYESLKNHQVYLMEQTLDLQSVVMLQKVFGDKLSFVGYPGRESGGSYFYMDGMYAMSSKSENKEGVWEFLSTIMSKKFQAKNPYTLIPTRQDAYEMYKRMFTTTEAYVDEYGKKVEPMDTAYQFDELVVPLGPTTDADVKLFEDALLRTTRMNQVDSTLVTIISEEVEPYFAGDKSAEEICKIVQNRVSTYVNENR